MDDEKQDTEWLTTTLLAHFESLLGTNMSYLHNAHNWALTILVGGVVVLTARTSFPDYLSLAALSVLLLVLIHFAVRTAKAYVNVMRWGTLERQIIRAKLTQATLVDWGVVVNKIEQLHCAWSSPLPLHDVAYKVLFELGFFYFLIVVVALIAYCLIDLGLSIITCAPCLLSLSFAAIEVYIGMVRSPYFARISPDDFARSQR
jgi:hypothetical protein